MQYSQEHLKTMVYAEFGGQKECIMGNWKIENCNKTTQIAVMLHVYCSKYPGEIRHFNLSQIDEP